MDWAQPSSYRSQFARFLSQLATERLNQLAISHFQAAESQTHKDLAPSESEPSLEPLVSPLISSLETGLAAAEPSVSSLAARLPAESANFKPGPEEFVLLHPTGASTYSLSDLLKVLLSVTLFCSSWPTKFN